MKKIITLLVTALAVTALTACTGSSENSNSGNDTTAVEQTEEPQANPQAVEKERFTLTLPEGWIDRKTDSKNSAQCNKYKDDKGHLYYSIDVWANTASAMENVEKAVAHMTEKGQLTAADDLVVGDKTFKVVKDNTPDGHTWLFANLPQGDGVLQIEVGIGDVNDSEVQQLLQSINLK